MLEKNDIKKIKEELPKMLKDELERIHRDSYKIFNINIKIGKTLKGIHDIFITYGYYDTKQVKIRIMDGIIYSSQGYITRYMVNEINDILDLYYKHYYYKEKLNSKN